MYVYSQLIHTAVHGSHAPGAPLECAEGAPARGRSWGLFPSSLLLPQERPRSHRTSPSEKWRRMRAAPGAWRRGACLVCMSAPGAPPAGPPGPLIPAWFPCPLWAAGKVEAQRQREDAQAEEE